MRFRTSPEVPDPDAGYCPDCDSDYVLEFVPEWLGEPAHHRCLNSECPSNQEEEDDAGDNQCSGGADLHPAVVRNLAPDNRISITVNA